MLTRLKCLVDKAGYIDNRCELAIAVKGIGFGDGSKKYKCRKNFEGRLDQECEYARELLAWFMKREKDFDDCLGDDDGKD